jgi:hypothetical protein
MNHLFCIYRRISLYVLVLMGLMLASTCSAAGELILHGRSVHSSYNKDKWIYKRHEVREDGEYDIYTVIGHYNNENYGIGYRTDKGVTFGLYKNSYYRLTAYVGKHVAFSKHFGAYVAVGTGYSKVSSYPLMLMGGLTVKVPLTEQISIELIGSPKLGKTDGLLHTTITYKF